MTDLIVLEVQIALITELSADRSLSIYKMPQFRLHLPGIVYAFKTLHLEKVFPFYVTNSSLPRPRFVHIFVLKSKSE